MLKDDILFLSSLFFALLGASLLYTLSKASEPLTLSPQAITPQLAGKTISIKGAVVGISHGDKFDSFKICSGKCVQIVDFKRREKLERGYRVSVQGRVAVYENESRLVADVIEITDSRP